jgi:dermatan/chondrotin sulfate uronyl 2-O-sulfotransferase UST
MHPDCNGFETEKALQRAKENVEKHYAVVAVLEEMNKSLYVFEKYIPKFFRNSRNLYDNLMKNTRENGVNKNLYKPKMSKELRTLLMQNFTMEIDFYEFCKARLQKQYLALL